MNFHLCQNYYELTLSLHEPVQKGAPVFRIWLDIVHAVKVEIGHCIVLRITGHIDHLQIE